MGKELESMKKLSILLEKLHKQSKKKSMTLESIEFIEECVRLQLIGSEEQSKLVYQLAQRNDYSLLNYKLLNNDYISSVVLVNVKIRQIKINTFGN